MNEGGPEAAGNRVDAVARDAIEELRWHWGDAYEIGFDDDRGWHARRRDGLGGRLIAADPDDLIGVIAADYALKPVPRSVTPADRS
jgi:hypothetical protein